MLDKDAREDRGWRTGFLLRQAYTRLTTQSNDILGVYLGLTLTQWLALDVICGDGPKTAGGIAEQGDLDKGLLSRALKSLEEHELIVIEANPEDRRERLVALTEKGRAIHYEARRLMKIRNDEVIAELDESDLAVLLRGLEAVSKAATKREFDF